jgi:hypothetical protein
LLLVAHLAGYLTALVWVLSPLQALGFVVVQQGLPGGTTPFHLHPTPDNPRNVGRPGVVVFGCGIATGEGFIACVPPP